MNEKLKKSILSITNSDTILDVQLIQNLWSGYGELNRIILNNNSVIVKLIKCPSSLDHPRGWNSDISHKRKVKSYEVETAWYKKHNQKIENANFPKYLTSNNIDDTKYLILEDLKTKGFEPQSTIEWEQVKLCLRWLAIFHAKHLDATPTDLWKIGTYWHLDTRPDELQILEDTQLKEAAPIIDRKLNDAKFKTIVHGDAKLANFLFIENEVSAVDFQYVGGGVGVKDVAYFLSSIYNEVELIQTEKECLDYYFLELEIALKRFNSSVNTSELETEWRDLYPFAWCDFYRFLKGWSPGHYKLNTYSEKMKDKVLKCI
jgi:hypothetical protein